MLLASCDEGKILNDASGSGEDSEGVTVRLAQPVTGAESYEGTPYSLALAAFADGNEYALKSRNIRAGEADVELQAVDASKASKAELCVISSLRERIVSFGSVELDGSPVATLEPARTDASLTGAVETMLMANCAQCHGGSNHAAAGLWLTDGHVNAEALNVASKKVPDLKRVQPGSHGSSVLWQVVATDLSSEWGYDHSKLLNSSSTKLLATWIDIQD